ncbi:MAG: hypothetical protein DDT27_01562 [Dehalococcoidia bacterium]|nr:hypothetical protein [Chloroflexota bacterium]
MPDNTAHKEITQVGSGQQTHDKRDHAAGVDHTLEQSEAVGLRIVSEGRQDKPRCQDQPDSIDHIPEHESKKEGKGIGDQRRGVPSPVPRDAEEPHNHLKGTKRPEVIEFRWRLL